MTHEYCKEILGDAIQPDGSLSSVGQPFVHWEKGSDSICLDDGYSLDELRAIVEWVKFMTDPL